MEIRGGLSQLQMALMLQKPAFGPPEFLLSVTGSRSALHERFKMK